VYFSLPTVNVQCSSFFSLAPPQTQETMETSLEEQTPEAQPPEVPAQEQPVEQVPETTDEKAPEVAPPQTEEPGTCYKGFY